MRDFCKISPLFWTGKTGKALRGKYEMQVVAMYLMTSPHSNMIGVYQLPLMYLVYETGLTMEGASKALQSLKESDFCTFDEATETIWVHEMAKYQIGEKLAASDKRCKGVRNELSRVQSNDLREGFADRYASDFHLTKDEKESKPHRSPIEAPSKDKKTPSKQEKRREGEVEDKTPLPPAGVGCRFEDFWTAWPRSERKQDKVKCAQKWKRENLDPIADQIIADINVKKLTEKWIGGFTEAPLVYLNGRRWEDGVQPEGPSASPANRSIWEGAL